MNREQKEAAVADLQKRLEQAQVAILASPKGLSVEEITQLRRELWGVGGEFKVAKNTLARIAVKETAFAKLDGFLEGQNGLVFGYDDPVAVAKVLVKFGEAHAQLEIRGGVLDGGRLEAEEIADLAKLPSREVVLAQLLALMQAPATQLVRTLQEPGARMVRLLEQLRAAREAGGAENE